MTNLIVVLIPGGLRPPPPPNFPTLNPSLKPREIVRSDFVIVQKHMHKQTDTREVCVMVWEHVLMLLSLLLSLSLCVGWDDDCVLYEWWLCVCCVCASVHWYSTLILPHSAREGAKNQHERFFFFVVLDVSQRKRERERRERRGPSKIFIVEFLKYLNSLFKDEDCSYCLHVSQ